ncbi:MAG: cytochrome c [Candidatus Sedimenticola sp. (ex Thyasira tokunagai)]
MKVVNSPSVRNILSTLWIATALLMPQTVWAETPVENESYYLTLGGRAYDNWMSLLNRETQEKRGLKKRDFLKNHPAYPAEGKKQGFTTWRCKECHGWDYRGSQGAYSTGSHFTGIKGIRAMQGAELGEIEVILRSDTHRYSLQMIDDETAWALALFISRGQIDVEKYIDSKTRIARGNPERGKSLYNTLCSTCHGLMGREINFKTPKKPEYVGTLAVKNPWELLHKIRNGHPGEEMISVQALEIHQQMDILSYTQSLPKR